MKDDEKMRTYAQGFKDGWNEAMKQSKMFDHPVMPSMNVSCPHCGRDGNKVYGMVCVYHNCPYTAKSVVSGGYATGTAGDNGSGMIGAAGSSRVTTLGAAGANGPTGYGY